MTDSVAPRVGAVVLAAGASSRLGVPKQGVRFRGEGLLRRVACAALDAGCSPVVVVTGAHADTAAAQLQGLAVRSVCNDQWATGLASSVRAGIAALAREEPVIDAALLLVCDQPHVTADVVFRLIAAYRASRKPVVASAYGETVGVPALFDRALFAELERLEGDTGARQVIARHASGTHLVAFPEGDVDVDTLDDLARLDASEGRDREAPLTSASSAVA
jgi:molybdenum cofactor cytidylyltransferase